MTRAGPQYQTLPYELQPGQSASFTFESGSDSFTHHDGAYAPSVHVSGYTRFD